MFYKVLSIMFANNKNDPSTEYRLQDGTIAIYSESENIGVLKVEKLLPVVGKMFAELSADNEGRAFELRSGSELLRLLKKDVMKASSLVKNDLDLVVLDQKTNTPTPPIGFSVKSQLGSPSTLITHHPQLIFCMRF